MMERLPTGVLNAEGVNKRMQCGELSVFPFSESQLTGCGYNLTATDFVFSTNKGVLQQIEIRNNMRYICVSPYDTVLICTKEYIRCPNDLMGTIHSRVAIVSEGFGHISTTVDPCWEGPMLIAINNPSKKKKRLPLDQPIATLVFHILSERTTKKHDNPPFRLDILEHYLQKNHGWKQILFRSRAVIQFQHLIELAKESVDIQQIVKSDFQELYMIEDVLSKMAYGDLQGWESELSQVGAGSLKFDCYSSPFRDALNSLQDAMLGKQWDVVAEKSRQAFYLCEREFVGLYWSRKSNMLKQEINKNSRNLAFINMVASRMPLKVFASLLLISVTALIVFRFFIPEVDNIMWENLTGVIAALITVLGLIWAQ